MNQRWKSWLASASVLLLVGAGCAGSVNQNASLGADTQLESREGGSESDTLDASVDAAFNAAREEADASSQQELEENADVGVVTNDDAELNAYGKAYDRNEL